MTVIAGNRLDANMSWLKDSGLGDENKRKEELKRRREAEVRRLDAMVCKLLKDVGEAKWGHHFSWDRSMTILPLGNEKHYKVKSENAPLGSGRFTAGWSVTGGPSVAETTYTVELVLGNPAQGTLNHFRVSRDMYGRDALLTADTSESELMNALKKVVVG